MKQQKAQWKTLWNRQNGRCFYCGKGMLQKTSKKKLEHLLMTEDHILPTSRGGNDKIKENKVLACRKCNNNVKRNLTLQEYIEKHGEPVMLNTLNEKKKRYLGIEDERPGIQEDNSTGIPSDSAYSV